MSGAGVFNYQGELIAIHNRADNAKQYNYDLCQPLEEQTNDLENNWGTLISEFLKQNLPKNIKDGIRKCKKLLINS